MTLQIGFVLSSAFLVSAEAQQASLRHLTSASLTVQKQEARAETDFYCPSREERGSFCLGDLRVTKLRGCTSLMRAAESGDIIQVRALIKRGVNVNAAWPSWGITALMLAAGEGHVEIVKALLNAGANPNAISFGHGGIPSWAWMFGMNRCNKSWLAVMDAMLSAGVEVNPKTIDPSPLAYAIERYDTVMIEAVLRRGAQVNLRDQETGETPLMFAARYSTPEVVKTLLGVGADAMAKNKQGKTALVIAEEGDNLWREEIVLLLKQSRAKQ